MRTCLLFVSLFYINSLYAHSFEQSFIKLAKEVTPSVVNISVLTESARVALEVAPGFAIPYQIPKREGVGSGFVISSDGLIVTNTHVIKGSDTIKVQFAGQKTHYVAKVLGKDDLSDIALLKINPKHKLKPIALGDNSKLQVGEWVAAIGNPHNYGHTMTKGIISAVKREIDDLNLFPLIQTDASINPGNSGGPLVNLKGEVVGVNNAIAAGATGISFAIPINNVKTVLQDLKNYGYVRRGFIGVQFRQFNSVPGVVITNLVKNGPAHKAGLKINDMIVEFNNTKIKSAKDLPKAVSKAPLNKKLKVTVIRNNQKKHVYLQTELPKK